MSAKLGGTRFLSMDVSKIIMSTTEQTHASNLLVLTGLLISRWTKPRVRLKVTSRFHYMSAGIFAVLPYRISIQPSSTICFDIFLLAEVLQKI